LFFVACALKVGRMAKKKNPHAVALGKMGGSKGGKLRAEKLSSEQRSEIARKAVLARWAKHRSKQQETEGAPAPKAEKEA